MIGLGSDKNKKKKRGYKYRILPISTNMDVKISIVSTIQ